MQEVIRTTIARAARRLALPLARRRVPGCSRLAGLDHRRSSIPDQYRSRTQVYVDTESLLKPLLSGFAVNRDVMSQVAMHADDDDEPREPREGRRRKTICCSKRPRAREQEKVIDELGEAS